MSKARLKFGVFISALLVFGALGAVGLSLLMQFITAFQQGANPASIFHGHQLTIPSLEDAAWRPSIDLEGSLPTQSEREELISAYWEAWDALRRAQLTGDISDLPTYWAGDAYREAVNGIDAERHIDQTHSGHDLQLSFFSDDGSVAAFTDQTFTLRQTVGDETLSVTATAAVIMTLDNGFWRVRSITLSYH